MENFKTLPKMKSDVACYKEGGSVRNPMKVYKKGGHTESEDIKQDKAIVKKAFKMHDEQSHEGEKTNLTKLKKGGRMKKKGGCVGRYKSGGGISYGAKKSKQDIKDIAAIKRMKPKMKAEGGLLKAVDAEENPGLAKLPTNVRNKMGYQKKGGTVKNCADGGQITDEERARMPAGKLPQQIVDEEATKENTETREMVAGPLRKLKQGIMETFKSKTKTPMKKGGKACQ